MPNLITSSKTPLSGTAPSVLSVMFGVVYAGVGLSYLAFADPDADPLALAIILLMSLFGWIGFLIFVRFRWKRVSLLSFPSHVLIILGIAVACSVFTWPLSVAVMYSRMSISIVTFCILCGLLAAFVALVSFTAYTFAMRSMDVN